MRLRLDLNQLQICPKQIALPNELRSISLISTKVFDLIIICFILIRNEVETEESFQNLYWIIVTFEVSPFLGIRMNNSLSFLSDFA